MTEFFRSYKPFVVHKRIEKPNQSSSLSWEILQVEQVETTKTGSPHRHLNIGLITDSTQCSRCHEKVSGLITQVIFLEPIPEYFKVPGFHNTCIFLNLIIIRIDLVPVSYTHLTLPTK